MEQKTSEEKKDWLQQYGNIDRKIKSLLEQKMELVESMTSTKAMNYDGMPKGGKQKDLAGVLIKFEKLCKTIDDKRLELLREKIKIEQTIFKLTDGKESEVIRKRYISLMTWEKIAESMTLDLRYVYRIHGHALNHIVIERQQDK